MQAETDMHLKDGKIIDYSYAGVEMHEFTQSARSR